MSEYKNIFTSQEDIISIKEACSISIGLFRTLLSEIDTTKSPFDIEKIAEDLFKLKKVTPAFKGVRGPYNNFPAIININLNETALHGIPFSTKKFQDGDVITLDFGIIHKGFYTDHAQTISLGKVSPIKQKLISATQEAVYSAIDIIKPGIRVGDISFALAQPALKNNFGIIEGFTGHGIGKYLHLEPHIPYIGRKNTGELIQEGMLLCIETQMSLGSPSVFVDKDGWTVNTKDGSCTSMWEEMVLVTKNGCEVLTSNDSAQGRQVADSF